jgi:hypothetical protein|tara:strand:- start:302 stop:799 length:498 start_codon:yes stop_codon:yes gene_type:complete
MKKVKKEVSTTGGVAGYDGVIPAVGNPTEKEVNQWKKKKKKFMKRQGKSKDKTYNTKSVAEAADKLIKDTILKVLLEQPGNERMNYIIRLFEGISKNLNTSLGYARMFILDALKMDIATGAAKLNAKRATAELNHIRKMIDDLESLLEKINGMNHEERDNGEENV